MSLSHTETEGIGFFAPFGGRDYRKKLAEFILKDLGYNQSYLRAKRGNYSTCFFIKMFCPT